MTGSASTDLIGEIPFVVYGVAGTLAPRRLAGTGHRRETINLVALAHGDRQDRAAPWVQVTVMGPVRSTQPVPGRPGFWSIDPLPMIMNELLNAAGVAFADAAEVVRVIDALAASATTSHDLVVDGRPMAFRLWRRGPAWAATGDLPGDMMVYVIARNIEPAEVELSSDVDLRQYLHSA